MNDINKDPHEQGQTPEPVVELSRRGEALSRFSQVAPEAAKRLLEADSFNGDELREFYERYVGVCDVYSPEESQAMADEVRSSRNNPNRKVMIGVMTHPLVLSDDVPVPIAVRDGVREVFPTKEEMAGGFIDDPDVLNTVHYADLYGPGRKWKAEEAPNVFKNLELVVKHGGDNLHAIQLDLTWPTPAELIKFADKYPDITLILQAGKYAFAELDNDLEAVMERLRRYGGAVGYVLFDMSMGMGNSMQAEGLLPILRATKDQLPNLGLAVAGGLGPDTVDLVKPIAEEFPDISIDAQGNLKHKDAPRDENNHLIATYPANLNRSIEYIRRSCEILDR